MTNLLTIAEAAVIARVSTKTLQRATRATARPLASIHIGRRVLIDRRDLDAWLNAQRVVAIPTGASRELADFLAKLNATPAQPRRKSSMPAGMTR